MTKETTVAPIKSNARGEVVKAYGNLLQVKFTGDVCQGEVAMVNVGGAHLKSEVLEIVGDEVKIQVFEGTNGIELGTTVEFTGELLEAELGPGLLTSIFDGLQNPLQEVADKAGVFLPRGIYVNALDRNKHWNYVANLHEGDIVKRGDTLGTTQEGHFQHHIMVPFNLYGKYTITWVIKNG